MKKVLRIYFYLIWHSFQIEIIGRRLRRLFLYSDVWLKFSLSSIIERIISSVVQNFTSKSFEFKSIFFLHFSSVQFLFYGIFWSIPSIDCHIVVNSTLRSKGSNPGLCVFFFWNQNFRSFWIWQNQMSLTREWKIVIDSVDFCEL